MARKLKEFEACHGYTKADWDEVSDNPELTDEVLEQVLPFGEAFPDLAESVQRGRGKQKAPTKQVIKSAFRRTRREDAG